MHSLKRSWWGNLLAAAILLTPATTRADEVSPDVLNAAKTLYAQGVALMDAKNFAEACNKLEGVIRLVPQGIGGRQALAECYEGLGKLASAWQQYIEIETLAKMAGESQTAAEARTNAANLRPKLATLRILVPNVMQVVPGVMIALDGVPLAKALWGTRIPVDVGKHAIEVSEPGRQTWARAVKVSTLGEEKDVNVPILKMSYPGARSSSSEPRSAGHIEMPAKPKPSSTWMRPLGGASLGLGIAGAGASLILYAADISSNTATIVGGAAGGVVAATGIVLLAIEPSSNDEAHGAKMQTTPGSRRWGVSIAPAGLGVWGVW